MNDRNSHTGSEKVSLTYKELIRLRDCRDKFLYGRLSLHRKGYERKQFIRSMFYSLMESLEKGLSMNEVFSLIEERFRTEFMREWFDFDAQFDKAVELNRALFQRLAWFLFSNGYSVQARNITASAPLNVMYKGVVLADVEVFAPVILRKDGRDIVVLFEDDVNPFSEAARKITNHPTRSIALTCAYLAFAPIYGTNIAVETWYLKGKDDKPGNPSTVFERKQGKNIARALFANSQEAFSRLQEAVSAEMERSCGSCKHKDICHFTGVVCNNPEKKDACVAGTKPRFTAAQEKVVNHVDGPMCCIAVPGAGKTFSLANRLVNLLHKGVAPENILFVTFTKKAAGELKQRVMDLMETEDETKIPAIFTFNAFGYRVLRENPLLLGCRVKVADTIDRLAIIGRALAACPAIKNTSYDDAYLEFGLVRMLSELFEEIMEEGKDKFRERYHESKDVEGILSVYDEYQRIFKENDFISYDMQISMVNTLFKKYPSLVEKYANKYRYIMVDEYQDTSEDQANMIYFIAKKHGNIVVVGDDDQSIYEWRGGSNRFMLEFDKDFPGAQMVFMNDNFRSNNAILRSANELISINQNRLRKNLTGHKEGKFKPAYWKQTTVHDIAKIITSAIKNGYKPGDIAVLGRTNKRLNEVMGALEGIVKVSASKDYIREDTVFVLLHDILALFYCGMGQDVALYRVLSFMGCKLRKSYNKDADLYTNLVKQNDLPVVDWKQAGALGLLELTKDISACYLAAYKLMQIFKCIQTSHRLDDSLNKICRILFDLDTHPVVEQLLDKADEKAIVKFEGLYKMMNDMIRFSDDAKVGYEPREDVVNLLTAHDSKGKEFPIVIIYATEDFKNEPEENRLLYVAMTRAKDTLFMLESVYSTCELLPFIQASVTVR